MLERISSSKAFGPIRRCRFLVAAAVAGAATICGPTASAQQSQADSIGLAAGFQPKYGGAKAYRALPLPYLSLSQGIFFVDGLSAGVAYPLTSNISVGPILAIGLGRKEGDAARLSGTGDIARNLQYGAFMRWHEGPASASIKFMQSAHGGYGGHVDLDLAYAVIDTGKDRVSIGAGTQWSNSSAAQTYFGINSQQAANSTQGLPEYHPSAGFTSINAKASWEHRFDNSWSMRSTLGVGSLLGDAANSPIVERRTSMFGSVGLAYRF